MRISASDANVESMRVEEGKYYRKVRHALKSSLCVDAIG